MCLYDHVIVEEVVGYNDSPPFGDITRMVSGKLDAMLYPSCAPPLYLSGFWLGMEKIENTLAEESRFTVLSILYARIRVCVFVVLGATQLQYPFAAGKSPISVQVLPLFEVYCTLSVVTPVVSHSMYCPVPVPKASPPFGYVISTVGSGMVNVPLLSSWINCRVLVTRIFALVDPIHGTTQL